MVFSSLSFLLAFLPVVWAAHALLSSTRRKNAVLLVASLVFLAWGELAAAGWMLAIVSAAFAGAHAVARTSGEVRRAALTTTLTLLFLPLLALKYAPFVLSSVGELLGAPGLSLEPFALPVGISFFTFQAAAFVVDVGRKDVVPPRAFGTVALYVSLFPQLVAGPIVRYSEVAQQLVKARAPDVGEGFRRFAQGLAKKVLVADTLAVPVDMIFALEPAELGTSTAWLGALLYALQIYFDFSGYSDMAVGLGRMLGFTFPENFHHPYRSRTITEFWRRWHVTLSSWFRDYVYIPLGGSRRGRARTVVNLFVVFVLCGLWHGAAVTFLLWGLAHGVALGLERAGLGRLLLGAPRAVGHLWVAAVLVLTWVLFRAESLDDVASYLAAMAGRGGEEADGLGAFATPLTVGMALVALFFALRPDLDDAGTPRPALAVFRRNLSALEAVATALVLVASFLSVVASTHHPFIYYRF